MSRPEPACLRMTVPEAYRDENGHMNVRWYAAILPFPPEIATKIQAGVAASAALDWPPPVCGVMRA